MSEEHNSSNEIENDIDEEYSSDIDSYSNGRELLNIIKHSNDAFQSKKIKEISYNSKKVWSVFVFCEELPGAWLIESCDDQDKAVKLYNNLKANPSLIGDYWDGQFIGYESRCTFTISEHNKSIEK